MNAPFYRACRRHGEELQERTVHTGHGPEILWCARGHGGGHRCRSWDVRDNGGEIVAVGFLNEAPQIESPELAALDFTAIFPEKLCQRGHMEWILDADGHYRCGACKRDRTLKALAKKAAELEAAKMKPPPKRRHPKGRQMVIGAALRYQVEQRRIERALKIVNNKIKKEQRCLIRPTP